MGAFHLVQALLIQPVHALGEHLPNSTLIASVVVAQGFGDAHFRKRFRVMCSQGARGHSAEGLRQFLSCFLHFQQLRNGDFRIANRKRGFYFAKIRRSTVFDLLGQFPYNGGHLILHPVHIGLRVIAVGEEIQCVPNEVHIIDVPVAEHLIFSKGGVLLSGAEQKIGITVEKTMRSSAGGRSFVCILRSKNARLDCFHNQPHALVFHHRFAVIDVFCLVVEMAGEVDNVVPVFTPGFVHSFLHLRPAFCNGTTMDLSARFARGGRGAADMLDKRTVEQIWVKLARRKNCWHRHDPILLSLDLKI